MDVDQHEALVVGRDSLKQLPEHRIISRVDGERTLDHARRRWLAPQIQPPALFASQINGFVGAAVQVEFEARTMGDDMGWDVKDGLAGERVFLAQPLAPWIAG